MESLRHDKFDFVKHSFKKTEFKKHFHKDYSIGLILEGTHKLELNKDNIIASKGEIKIINPYDLHIADGTSPWKYLNFMPDEKAIKDFAQDLCDDIVDCDIRFNSFIKDQKATHYLLKIANSLNNTLEYEENLTIFISYLLKHYGYKNIHIKDIPKNIKNSIEYIHENFLENLSLDEIAFVSGLSKYHFIKLFKEKTGLTPHKYIIDLRIEHAKILMKKNIPFSQIALYCGFSDQSHFIRSFKKHYGYTPVYLN